MNIFFYLRKFCVILVGICVEENCKIGYCVGDIIVIDLDIGDIVICDVVSGNVFKIENDVVFVNGDINFEVLDSLYFISVEIRCRDKGGFVIEKSYNISVLDVNDVLSFVFLLYYIVSFNVLVGSFVGLFIVVDED